MFKAYKNPFYPRKKKSLLPSEKILFIWISHKGQMNTYRDKI